MMFMMPMPPTSRLTAAIPASSRVKTCVVSPERGEEVGLVADGEVVGLPAPQPVLAAQDLLDLGHGDRDVRPRSAAKHVDRAQPVGADQR